MSFFSFSSDVTKSTARLFFKFSIVLLAMNESINELVHMSKQT